MTLSSLFWTWVLIVAVCVALCAVARLVWKRVDDAERRRSRRDWQRMCSSLGLRDAADGRVPPLVDLTDAERDDVSHPVSPARR